MLKHILTGQQQQQQQQQQQHQGGPGSRLHHHHEFASAAASLRSPRAQSSADVYDNVPRPQVAPSGGPSRHHHSQLSVNNLALQRHQQQQQHNLNLSTLSTSKHSVNSVSPYANGSRTHALIAQLQHQQQAKINGGLDISRISRLPTPSPAPARDTNVTLQAANNGVVPAATTTTTTTGSPLNVSWTNSSSSQQQQQQQGMEAAGVKEMLTSLGLLCLVSLLLALLSLTFLVRMSAVQFVPNSLISQEEFAIVYDVTLVLCALALSLNLCCLLVCAVQFLFAVKLVKSSYHGHRTNKYLQKSSVSRVCAVGGFFISIPVFLTGMILYTFIQFQSTPAIVTSVFIGLGIVFCGCALVHTVFVWQKEKTNAMKALRREQYEAAAQLQRQQTLHSQQTQQQQHQHHHQQQQHQHQQQQQHQTTISSPQPLHQAQSHHHPHSQQQQQQHHPQHQHQQHPNPTPSQLRPMPMNYGAASRLATSSVVDHHPISPRPPQPHRHVSMSPPPLLSLNASTRSAHLLHHHLHHHHQLASPPATPGDRSPTSPPANKYTRSREAVTGSVSPGIPAANLDLSSAGNANSPHELSTLV